MKLPIGVDITKVEGKLQLKMTCLAWIVRRDHIHVKATVRRSGHFKDRVSMF